MLTCVKPAKAACVLHVGISSLLISEYIGFNITLDRCMETADRAKYFDQNNVERP